YCDLMHATPEALEMDENDQIIMARKNFHTFFFLIMALWSQTSNKPGICLSNGAYFPTLKEEQQYPDVNDCAGRCVDYLNQPIRALALTEVEQAVVAYLSCFIDDVPTLSVPGCKKYSAIRDRLI
ncbi:hypothetical protein PENTCL1PPCAC_1222, partial [Pristionchus entomophagus]